MDDGGVAGDVARILFAQASGIECGVALVGFVDEVGDALRHDGGVEFESEFFEWHGWGKRGYQRWVRLEQSSW